MFFLQGVARYLFVPMALASSAGSEVQKPLATVVIGGLLTLGLIGIFVGPVLLAVVYTLLSAWVRDGETADTPQPDSTQ